MATRSLIAADLLRVQVRIATLAAYLRQSGRSVVLDGFLTRCDTSAHRAEGPAHRRLREGSGDIVMTLKVHRLLVGAVFVVGMVAFPAAGAFADPGNGNATGRHGCGNPGGAFSVVAKIRGFSTAELTRFADGTTPGGLVKTLCTPAGP